MPSEKRKVYELEDEHHPNGNRSKLERKSKEPRLADIQDADKFPFEIHCPPRPEDTEEAGAFQGHAKIADNWDCDYGVITKAGTPWQKIKSYKKVKLGGVDFARDDIVYILNNPDPPDPPKSNTSGEEELEWDKKNLYVGKIVEARAESADKVFILVAYLYWPDEIPPQQKKTHNFYGKVYARGELIMSNHLQVIDATSISRKADISYWDEWNDDHLDQAPERFWRQQFDNSNFNQKHDSATALTELRKYCKCRRPYNLDHPMYHHTTGCTNWNHEECLIEEIGSRVSESYGAGNMEQYVKDNAPGPSGSLTDAVLQPVKNMGKKLEDKFEDIVGQGIDVARKEPNLHPSCGTPGHKPANTTSQTASNANKDNRGRPKKSRWKNKLDISLIANRKDRPLLARIQEKSSGNVWQVKVDCLCCGTTMD